MDVRARKGLTVPFLIGMVFGCAGFIWVTIAATSRLDFTVADAPRLPDSIKTDLSRIKTAIASDISIDVTAHSKESVANLDAHFKEVTEKVESERKEMRKDLLQASTRFNNILGRIQKKKIQWHQLFPISPQATQLTAKTEGH